jgi:thiamine-monophosphate kinase
MTSHVRATSHQSPATVSDLTERELVARIERHLSPRPPWMLVGIGDDAAVIAPERNRVEVLTVDAIVEGIHFDRTFVPPAAIGHRALAVNLSDLAAMGAAPRVALLSFVLPSALSVSDFDAIAGGLAALAARHRMHVAGGNLTRTTGPLVIDVTAIGTVKRRQALTRAGAQPGDDLYLSGTIGASTAGLQMLTQSAAAEHTRAAIERYLHPDPRIRLGTLLSRNRAAAACMDVSDGLADAVHQLADASGVGAVIDAASLPIDAAARAWFESHGADPVAQSLAGDDYELLVAVPPRSRRRLTAVVQHAGVPLTRVGVCTPGPAVLIRRDGADTPMPSGYSHFRR